VKLVMLAIPKRLRVLSNIQVIGRLVSPPGLQAQAVQPYNKKYRIRVLWKMLCQLQKQLSRRMSCPRANRDVGIRTMECNASCVVRFSHQRTHCINIWTKCVCVASCSGRRKAIELTEEDGKLVLASDRLRGVLSPLLWPRHWTQLQMPVAGGAHRLVQYVLLLLSTREQFADGLRKCGENLEAT